MYGGWLLSFKTLLLLRKKNTAYGVAGVLKISCSALIFRTGSPYFLGVWLLGYAIN
jgi:hypothetical protein